MNTAWRLCNILMFDLVPSHSLDLFKNNCFVKCFNKLCLEQTYQIYALQIFGPFSQYCLKSRGSSRIRNWGLRGTLGKQTSQRGRFRNDLPWMEERG